MLDVAGVGAAVPLKDFQRRRLASAVGAQESDNAPLGDLQRYTLEDEDHVVVDHLDIVDAEKWASITQSVSSFCKSSGVRPVARA